MALRAQISLCSQALAQPVSASSLPVTQSTYGIWETSKFGGQAGRACDVGQLSDRRDENTEAQGEGIFQTGCIASWLLFL